MGLLGWITGRDEREADVYANFEKVDQVVGEIRSISVNQVESAKNNVRDAMGSLQSALSNIAGVNA